MKYIPALDGIRALAVILVMLGHAGVVGFPGGGFGVDMFFVLSGFLITALLLEEMDATGRVNLLHFYARRALRLYPALLLFLLLYAIFFHIMGHGLGQDTSRAGVEKDVTLTALYLGDYAMAFGYQNKNSMLAHTWSLGVEEQFYLVWPCLLILLRRLFKGRNLIAMMGLLYALAWAWKLFCLSFQPWEMVYFRFDTRLSGLILGAALALCRREGLKLKYADGFLLGAGLVFAWCIVTMPSMEAGNFETAPAEIFTFLLIYKIMEEGAWKPAQWLSRRFPVFFGRISYGLYLFHFPAAYLCVRFNVPWYIAFELSLAVALGLAWFSWNTVERAGRIKAREFRLKEAERHLRGD